MPARKHKLDTAHAGVYADDTKHTCICLNIVNNVVRFIPMSVLELSVCKMYYHEFARTYKAMPAYAPQRAAARYLHQPDGVHTPITPEARAYLELIAGPTFVRERLDDVDPKAILANHSQPEGTEDMNAPAKRPAAKKTAEASAAPAKKAAAKKTDKKTAEPAVGRRGRPPAYDPNSQFKVVNGESVTRGTYKEIVDAATALGKFTYEQLEKACKKIELSENQLKNTFGYAVRHGVFAAV